MRVVRQHIFDFAITSLFRFFEVRGEILGDIAAFLFDGIDEMGFIHHIVVSVRDDFFKVICQEFSANIESTISGFLRSGMDRLTADQMTFPFTMGVMFVKEKPESTTRTHSDMERVPRTSGCHGISDGPEVSPADYSKYPLL